MKNLRKVGAAAVAALFALGLLAAGSGASAQAGDDSSWGWKVPPTKV